MPKITQTKRTRAKRRSNGASGGFFSLFSSFSKSSTRRSGMLSGVLFSNRAMLAVVATVVIVGTGVVLYSSAATQSFNWSAKVTSTQRTATYKVTSNQAGSVSASLKWVKSAKLRLRLAEPNGAVVYDQSGT